MLLCERSWSEKATDGMIPAIWCSGKGKTMETVKGLVVARDSEGGKGGMNRNQEFQSSEIIQYDIVIVDTCHCVLSKPTELRKKEPQCQLWALITNNVSISAHCNKYTTLMEMIGCMGTL